jgi:hypothetical protein
MIVENWGVITPERNSTLYPPSERLIVIQKQCGAVLKRSGRVVGKGMIYRSIQQTDHRTEVIVGIVLLREPEPVRWCVVAADFPDCSYHTKQ